MISLQIEPASIFPGHRASMGTRNAPSQLVFFSLRNGVMQGRVTEYDPPNALAYLWGEDAATSSEVRYELTAKGDETYLVLTHRRLSAEQINSVAAGWHTHLDILIARLSNTEPEGFWRQHTRLEREYAQRLR